MRGHLIREPEKMSEYDADRLSPEELAYLEERELHIPRTSRAGYSEPGFNRGLGKYIVNRDHYWRVKGRMKDAGIIK